MATLTGIVLDITSSSVKGLLALIHEPAVGRHWTIFWINTSFGCGNRPQEIRVDSWPQDIFNWPKGLA